MESLAGATELHHAELSRQLVRELGLLALLLVLHVVFEWLSGCLLLLATLLVVFLLRDWLFFLLFLLFVEDVLI